MRPLNKWKLLEKKSFQLNQLNPKLFKFQPSFKRLLQLQTKFQRFMKLRDITKKSSKFHKLFN